MAFRAAGRLAFRDAMAAADPVVLEPVAHVDVTVPAEVLGDVMGDLNARRGKVLGPQADETGEPVIHALVPTSEMARYTVSPPSPSGDRQTLVWGTGWSIRCTQ